ncbi:MAG: dTDP-4-dehydrorhamnose 3,5-epimerase family protein [Flavobacteriales bacterium]|nr:dTDP-4-dehydrorhamnose 3,5-epimerase family protein [Flavobacteriales bacterium]PCH89220.1 MAG: dTDP-4-dehydrorhamnose 3,5-epimerase [Flavobacteriales bacterium]
MNLIELKISGAFEIKLPFSEDDRGDFVKILHADSFREHGLEPGFRESYYSTSRAGVIRGMHFQSPPHDHEKLVYCVEGKVLDVLLDLRADSQTFQQYCTVQLAKDARNAVYIPRGVAHGFCVQEGSASLVYMTTTVYDKESDTGVLWNSFGFDWPVDNPLISERDTGFEALNSFQSPF